MRDDAAIAAPRPPLVCELICGEVLEGHVEAFRTWADLMWSLTVEALVSSGTVERPEDVYDRALWDGVVGIGYPPEVRMRTRRLTARAWSEMLAGDELHGFGVSAGPLPNVPEPPGSESSTIIVASNWHPTTSDIPNAVSWLLPARYTTGVDDSWVSRLVEGFAVFGTATRVRCGLVGWTQGMMQFRGYRQWEIDFTSRLWLPGWAMLLSEGHIAGLGGGSALDATGLFRPVEQVGDGTYLVRSRLDLLDFDAPALKEVESVLEPILLPPPYQGLDQS